MHAIALTVLLKEISNKFIGSRLIIINTPHEQASRRKLKKKNEIS
jgi:hypothetical protein